jgi:hypothetical protein
MTFVSPFAVLTRREASRYWPLWRSRLGSDPPPLFSGVIQNTLLDPFPYRDSKRIVVVRIHDLAQSGPGGREPDRLHPHESCHLRRCPGWLSRSNSGWPVTWALPGLRRVRKQSIAPSSASATETIATSRCATELESSRLATWPARVYSSSDVIPTCPQNCRDR